MERLIPVLLILAFSASGCVLNLGGPFESSQPLDVPALSEQVAAVRQLPLQRPIPYQALDPAQLKTKLDELNAEQSNPAQSEAAEKVLQFLGLLPVGENLQALMDRLYGEQILGFYDPEEGKLYLVNRGGGDVEERITIAHELVHGLTDQHFDLKRFDAPAFSDNDDLTSAVDALIEGDASLGETLYMQEGGQSIGSFLGMFFGGLSEDTSQLDAAPPYIRDSLLFPYQAGLSFVQALYDQGGWTAVDQAYGEPPVSTEQIMHPSKYLAGDDPPLPVTLTSTPEELSSWGRVYENVLGEFDFASWFRTLLPTEKADRAAAGWGGCRYQLWQKGQDQVFLMESLWDSPQDAQEAETALEAWATKRFPGTTKRETGAVVQEGEGQVTILSVSKTTVRLVTAPTRALADALVQQLP